MYLVFVFQRYAALGKKKKKIDQCSFFREKWSSEQQERVFSDYSRGMYDNEQRWIFHRLKSTFFDEDPNFNRRKAEGRKEGLSLPNKLWSKVRSPVQPVNGAFLFRMIIN